MSNSGKLAEVIPLFKGRGKLSQDLNQQSGGVEPKQKQAESQTDKPSDQPFVGRRQKANQSANKAGNGSVPLDVILHAGGDGFKVPPVAVFSQKDGLSSSHVSEQKVMSSSVSKPEQEDSLSKSESEKPVNGYDSNGGGGTTFGTAKLVGLLFVFLFGVALVYFFTTNKPRSTYEENITLASLQRGQGRHVGDSSEVMQGGIGNVAAAEKGQQDVNVSPSEPSFAPYITDSVAAGVPQKSSAEKSEEEERKLLAMTLKAANDEVLFAASKDRQRELEAIVQKAEAETYQAAMKNAAEKEKSLLDIATSAQKSTEAIAKKVYEDSLKKTGNQ